MGDAKVTRGIRGSEDVKRREDGREMETLKSLVPLATRHLFVDNGVEDNPGETVVLEWGELGGLMEDEHCGHLRC